MLYSGLRLPYNQPNLEVCDVLKKITHLNLQMSKDLGFFYPEHMFETLSQLMQCDERQAGVLIIPPDKSVAVLAGKQEIAVFDSHEHGKDGGLIGVCRSKNISDFFNPLAQREAPAEGRKPEGEGANLDRRLVPYHEKC